MNMRDQLARLTRGAAQIISEAELAEKLSANRPLRVKLGVDPTSADIHLGHTVVLRKLRDFQELGHQAILIIGDFTALIGDPSGTDQLFNNLLGRDLQKQNGQPQQIVLLTPILEGLDGKQKMSKSLGNYVALNDPPAEMFGKLMSISDELMARYYLLLLSRALPKSKHPLEAKKELAAEIVSTYHSRDAANKANEEWTTRFSEKRLSETELPILSPQSDEVVTVVVKGFAVHGITKSRAEASRLIKQGSVQLDGAKLTNPTSQISLNPDQVLRLDKTHAVRIA